MLSPYNRAVGRFVDVVRYDFSVTKGMGTKDTDLVICWVISYYRFDIVIGIQGTHWIGYAKIVPVAFFI